MCILKLLFNDFRFFSSLWDGTLEVIVQSLAWWCLWLGGSFSSNPDASAYLLLHLLCMNVFWSSNVCEWVTSQQLVPAIKLYASYTGLWSIIIHLIIFCLLKEISNHYKKRVCFKQCRWPPFSSCTFVTCVFKTPLRFFYGLVLDNSQAAHSRASVTHVTTSKQFWVWILPCN